ncbi:hypothetical protein ACIQZO_16780 [Streptomyces sp. NPDC097617]|uniref:hypothetical protein n=1 Tax=Streptomyces sp. NPDC097617 TaxID=3366091 RepID=UPI0038003BD4
MAPTIAHCTPEPLIGTRRCGLLFDEWTEVVPAVRETTGIAVHFDRPGSEPPQAMLLVVPPVRTGAWREDDLVAAVTETFALARSRAVEPAHLDDQPYAHLLPATVLPAARQPGSPSPSRRIWLCATCGGRRMSEMNEVRIEKLREALDARSAPTVGLWNRLEGRPRTTDFDRALRVEVRDPLWMLTRQWQLGEFRGEDCGSPVVRSSPPRSGSPECRCPGGGPWRTAGPTSPRSARTARTWPGSSSWSSRSSTATIGSCCPVTCRRGHWPRSGG